MLLQQSRFKATQTSSPPATVAIVDRFPVKFKQMMLAVYIEMQLIHCVPFILRAS
jgi:hypothetical protein